MMETKTIQPPDLRERGGIKDGQPQFLDRRLYIQLQVFGGCTDLAPIIASLDKGAVLGTVYRDLHDPHGIGLVVANEDPNFFVEDLRDILQEESFRALTHKPAYTMFGRTYSIGYEPDLEHWLLHKPRQTLVNRQWPWAIWYPLRRSGAFVNLPHDQQRSILGEHGTIGQSFGKADLVHDIRLSCHGLDTHDNDFVIGLVGRDLHPLSAIVQTMRKTTQTSQYLDKLGPFFVGKAAWQAD